MEDLEYKSKINEYLKKSYEWMYQFLKETEKIQHDKCPEEIRKARCVIYQHYSSLNTLWLDCEGDFSNEIQHYFTSPFLTIHIVMALTLYERFDLLNPVHKSYRRFQKRANLALAGKKCLENLNALK